MKPDDTTKTLGERITQARNAKNLQRNTLAELVGVSAPTVTDWESGMIKEIGARKLLAVARTLGVTQEWLLTGETTLPPNDEITTVINACPSRRRESLVEDIRYLVTANDERYELMREALYALALSRTPKEQTADILKQLL
jgi:transcriptional regulator with XRE-family HTH domain